MIKSDFSNLFCLCFNYSLREMEPKRVLLNH
uniref:Uncharacterized protein n=1 Tax=Megaselia scalaris TaxID=36166 RepID=T1GCY5_MEGSC